MLSLNETRSSDFAALSRYKTALRSSANDGGSGAEEGPPRSQRESRRVSWMIGDAVEIPGRAAAGRGAGEQRTGMRRLANSQTTEGRLERAGGSGEESAGGQLRRVLSGMDEAMEAGLWTVEEREEKEEKEREEKKEERGKEKKTGRLRTMMASLGLGRKKKKDDGEENRAEGHPTTATEYHRAPLA